jgi:hypothetical protein
LDVLGQIGTDPGTEWRTMTVGTLNQTLRRTCSVTTGDTIGNNTFEPHVQWLQFAVNTTNGLGVRLCPCPGGNTTCP